MKFQLVREVPSYEVMPLFFGFAYRRIEKDARVCALMPFNIVLSVAHRAWLWLKCGARFEQETRWEEYGRALALAEHRGGDKMRDAYMGAMEDKRYWKGRAQRAEQQLRLDGKL